METRLYKMVEASLLDFSSPFSVEDVFKTVEVKRNAWELSTNYQSVSAYLSKLFCQGKLERLAPGIYCKPTETQETPAKYKVYVFKIVATSDTSYDEYAVEGPEPFSVVTIEDRPAVEGVDYREEVSIRVLHS